MRNKKLFALSLLAGLAFIGLIALFAKSNEQRFSTSPAKNSFIEDDVERSAQDAISEGLKDGQFSYLDYSPEILDRLNNKKVLLFFFAPWCPTCRAAEKEIMEKGAFELPKDLVVLKVDYDSSIALRKKYGVTVQHTFVQISGIGGEENSWIGGGVSAINQNLE